MATQRGQEVKGHLLGRTNSPDGADEPPAFPWRNNTLKNMKNPSTTGTKVGEKDKREKKDKKNLKCSLGSSLDTQHGPKNPTAFQPPPVTRPDHSTEATPIPTKVEELCGVGLPFSRDKCSEQNKGKGGREWVDHNTGRERENGEGPVNKTAGIKRSGKNRRKIRCRRGVRPVESC